MWRLIDTAPKDGKPLILGDNLSGAVGIGWWDAEVERWGWTWDYPPTHWMNLPELPER